MNESWARQLVHGVDLAFSFAPYAAVYTHEYHPASAAAMLFGGALLAAAYSRALLRLALGRNHTRLLLVLLAMLGCLSVTQSRDALFLCYPLRVALALGQPQAASGRLARAGGLLLDAALCVLLGFLPLVKGSLLAPCAGVWLLCAPIWRATAPPAAGGARCAAAAGVAAARGSGAGGPEPRAPARHSRAAAAAVPCADHRRPPARAGRRFQLPALLEAYELQSVDDGLARLRQRPGRASRLGESSIWASKLARAGFAALIDASELRGQYMLLIVQRRGSELRLCEPAWPLQLERGSAVHATARR